MQVFIDATGADAAAIARLEAGVRSLGAQMQAMPAGIADARRRGGDFSRAIGR